MKIDTLKTLLHEGLKEIYDAEKRLVRAIAKMGKAASSRKLCEALTDHVEVTRSQVDRLEQIFALLDVPAKAKPCARMLGIIEEGDAVLQTSRDNVLQDLAIIGVVQRVERQEMAAYASVHAMAEQLGNPDIAELLNQTWEEEREADETLAALAEQLQTVPDIKAKGKAAHSGMD